MTMPIGKYYVGDLCYVMHEEWDEVCDLTINDNRCLDGEFVLKDGRRFAMYRTMHGDGIYYDNSGDEYSVDAGLIGCILLSDIDMVCGSNFLHGGQIQNFFNEFETFEENGTIHFGNIEIKTDDTFDGEDEE